MRSFGKIIFIFVLIALVGFTLVVNDEKVNEPVASDDAVANVEESITADRSLVEYVDLGKMRASWYGPGFHGQKTANGERYDQMSFTAAHKSLKFGTLLKITNLKNNKSVVVRVNDRGPYIEGRDLDLSKAAALSLGMVKRGVAKIKVEEIKIAGLESQNFN